jgi:hypothetical protein
MQARKSLALIAALLGSAALTPVMALAAGLPTCSQLAGDPAYGLAGNVLLSQTTSDNEGLVSPSAIIVPATATNAAYCKVHLEYSSRPYDPNGGYVQQHVGINIGLPLSSADGGHPTSPKGYSWTAVNGAWNGKVENLGGGGLVGSLGSTTAATNAGYVGSVTDGGHNSIQANNGAFGVTAQNKLDVGQIVDFASESLHQQYIWALALAKSYYGQAATRNYWNGCSTGGRQGFELAQRWGEDFDGFLNGAPVVYYNSFQMAKAWPGLIDRDVVVAGGSPAITVSQYNNVAQHAVASCDVQGTDVVADGVVDDPRQCNYDPRKDPTILTTADGGTCTGTLCLNLVQAEAMVTIWNGPKNHFGKNLYYGWMKNIQNPSQFSGPVVPTGSISIGMVYDWDHENMSANVQNVYSSRELAAANSLGLPNPTALEDEYQLNQSAAGPGQYFGTDYQGIIDHVHNGPKHGKVIHWSGGNDALVFMPMEIHWYRATATAFGHGHADYGGLSSWYRYYHAPGVGHCGGDVGADPTKAIAPDGQLQAFTDLVNWVENGVVPQSAGDSTHEGILATGPGTFGTRPICPYPTTAIYNGSGSTTVASNYHCGGNLDTNQTLCQLPFTQWGRATNNNLDWTDLNIVPGQCGGNGADKG